MFLDSECFFGELTQPVNLFRVVMMTWMISSRMMLHVMLII